MTRTILGLGSLFLVGGLLAGVPSLGGEASPAAPPPAQPTTTATVDLGYQDVDVDGSLPRFGQYLLPPEDLFLQRLLLNSQDETGHTVFQAQLYDLGEDFHRGAAAITSPDLGYSLHYRFDRARFFPEPTFLPTPQIGRRLENTARFHFHPSGIQFAEMRFQHLRVTEPGLLREGSLAYRADNADLRGIIPTGPGQIDLRYSWLTFVDATGRQPETTTRTYGAEYSQDLGTQATLAASYTRSNIDQVGLPESKVQIWRVAGGYTPRPQWDAQGRYERRTIDLGITQNAYTRKNLQGTLKVTYRPSSDLAVRLAYERRDLERFNAVRTWMNATQWQILRLTGNWQGPNRLGVDAHYEWRTLQDDPHSAIPRTTDTDPLTPDKERRFEMKANLPFAARGFAYALFRDRRRENEARNMAYTLRTTGLGGFYQASSHLSLEATLGQDDWKSNTPVLQGMIADAKVLTLNGNYALSPQTWVSSSFSRYRGNQVGDVDDDQWTLSANHQWPHGGEVTLTYQNGNYDNSGFPGLDYEADRWKIAYSQEF